MKILEYMCTVWFYFKHFCCYYFKNCSEKGSGKRHVKTDWGKQIRGQSWNWEPENPKNPYGESNNTRRIFAEESFTSKIINWEDLTCFFTVVLLYHRFAGIAQTGLLDKKTKEYMIKPRCGMPDINEDETSYRRKKRYTLHGTTWRDVSVSWL